MGEKDEGGKDVFANVESVWVSFLQNFHFSFLSARYKSDGLYCRMEGTPSSPTLFFIRVETSKMPVVARNIKILWEKRMDEGRPYLQMWRGVRVNCHSFVPIHQI